MRYGGNTACVDVQLADGSRVILDAGTGLRALGQSLPSLLQLDSTAAAPLALLLTHLHSDHVIGLAHFAPIITRSHRVRIACGGVNAATLRVVVDQQLSAPLFPTLDGIAQALTVEAFDAADSFVVSTSCCVRAFAAHHPGGASILRVDDAIGPLVAYAPDNELACADEGPSRMTWRAGLVESLRGIPVLLHDATYSGDELAMHRGWGHSSAEEATQFAMQCEAGTLVLTHHHPDRSDDDVDAIVARCRAIVQEAGSTMTVMAAAEGMLLDVVPG